MSIIARIGANQLSYPYLHCDFKQCEKERIIEGVAVHRGDAMRVKSGEFAYPPGWVSVAIVTEKAEYNYDACCPSHAASLFAPWLQSAVVGVGPPKTR